MSFEEEFAVLCDWLRQKTREYHEALRKENQRGLDSPLNIIHKQNTMEYNRRLRELKEKYNIVTEVATLAELRKRGSDKTQT